MRVQLFSLGAESKVNYYVKTKAPTFAHVQNKRPNGRIMAISIRDTFLFRYVFITLPGDGCQSSSVRYRRYPELRP